MWSQQRQTPLAFQIHRIAAGERSQPGSPPVRRRPKLLFESDSPRAAEMVDSRIARLSRVEAVLFVARQPLNTRRIAKLANLADATEARTLVSQLAAQYDATGSAFQVENVAGGYRLLTRPEFAPWLVKIGVSRPLALKLSPPALDTLAVVAYRQPVLRAEIEAIRGVACGDILRQLIERDLLRIVGRSRELGKPLLYGTTKPFLQMFGLRSLSELPDADKLLRSPAA